MRIRTSLLGTHLIQGRLVDAINRILRIFAYVHIYIHRNAMSVMFFPEPGTRLTPFLMYVS